MKVHVKINKSLKTNYQLVIIFTIFIWFCRVLCESWSVPVFGILQNFILFVVSVL